jgi:hypothetical protein
MKQPSRQGLKHQTLNGLSSKGGVPQIQQNRAIESHFPPNFINRKVKQMKKTTFLSMVLIALTVLALASIAADGGRPITVMMTGAAERPGPGDPDGSGTAQFRLNPGQEQICYELTVTNITLPAVGVHIHIASADSPGPVVIPLTPPDASGTSSGCVSVDRDLILAILHNPENYYVNVHSTEYPAGAVRAQLSK